VNVTTIPAIAIDRYLKLVRIPLDTAVGFLPGNGDGRGPAAGLALDRADATLRTIAATLLGDADLRRDAQRRRTAADEREKALRLRADARRKTEQADAKLATRHDRAERERAQADERAEARREQAGRKRDEKARQAARAEAKRRQATRKAAEKNGASIDSRERKARLDALETKAEALEEKEEALTAADEAKRLADAAARTKAKRRKKD
jgi:hypothetical protein